MRKILIVAKREYLAAVRTKTFLIGLLIMPVMMGASALFQYVLRDVIDLEDKRFVVVDRAERPEVVAFLQEAVEAYNEAVVDPETGKRKKPRFVVESVPAAEDVSEQRFQLSERVRDGDILGFLELLPPDALPLPPDDQPKHQPEKVPSQVDVVLRYQTNRPTFLDFAVFAERTIGELLRTELARNKGLSEEETKRLVKPVYLDNKGLARRDAEGRIDDDSEQNRFDAMIVPTVLIVLMFMIVLMGSTPLMQGVVEEKMQRIAEVLLGSVRPFELMLGKLVGMTGVSLTIGGVYLGGAYWAAHNFGIGDAFTVPILLWFVVFQILASLMFGSLFIAVGAACTEMKETQHLVLPIMILACIPLFVMGNLLREPNGPVIRGLTYFPFATPALMLGRLAIVPNLPWWEPFAGILVVLATTLLCVWIAGRVFRVGLLLQGKAGIGQILRWIWKG